MLGRSRSLFVSLSPNHIGLSSRCISKTRYLSTWDDLQSQDVVFRLRTDLKTAMKAKDSFTSTTIRSVLAEIYAAQKSSPQKTFQHPDFISIIRKAEQRRLDAATQFDSASRPDLAEKEKGEARILSGYLPSLLSPNEINALIRDVVKDLPEDVKSDPNASKAKGAILKEFYKRVDKNNVEKGIVKQQLDEMFASPKI